MTAENVGLENSRPNVTTGQEALLPQTDRATRCGSRNAANCCTTGEASCTSNPQLIEVTESQGLQWTDL